MATTATMEMGLSRMSDEDYSLEFGTPRPGTQELSESTARWIFSQVAKTSAQETKKKDCVSNRLPDGRKQAGEGCPYFA